MDFVQIIDQLKNLPEEFKPITVCLHFVDILKDKHLLFEKAGFECVTAGHMFNRDFISNFYDILIQFKYSLSNDVGSHTFYSIELGIPFSLLGESAQVTITKSEELENLLLNKNLAYQDQMEGLIGRETLNYGISPELKEVVIREMGIGEGMGSFRLSFILMISSIMYFTTKFVEKLFK